MDEFNFYDTTNNKIDHNNAPKMRVGLDYFVYPDQKLFYVWRGGWLKIDMGTDDWGIACVRYEKWLARQAHRALPAPAHYGDY